jgi:hypothetical protein
VGAWHPQVDSKHVLAFSQNPVFRRERELEPIHGSAIGLDVHQKHVTATLIAEQDDGSIRTETVTFGTFKRDRHDLAKWVRQAGPGIVVMESTGIYWRSIYAMPQKSPREGFPGGTVHGKRGLINPIPQERGCHENLSRILPTATENVHV